MCPCFIQGAFILPEHLPSPPSCVPYLQVHISKIDGWARPGLTARGERTLVALLCPALPCPAAGFVLGVYNQGVCVWAHDLAVLNPHNRALLSRCPTPNWCSSLLGHLKNEKHEKIKRVFILVYGFQSAPLRVWPRRKLQLNPTDRQNGEDVVLSVLAACVRRR